MPTEQAPRSRTRLAWIVIAFVLAQVAAVAVYRLVQRDREQVGTQRFRAERLEAPAAPMAMLRADGSPLTLESLSGRPVLLHFWATWCAPCRVEMPALLALADAMKEDVAIVAVALDDDPSTVRSFFDGHIPPPVVLARAADAEQAYGVSALPDSYLLDATGQPRLRMLGPRNWLSPEARMALLKFRGVTERD